MTTSTVPPRASRAPYGGTSRSGSRQETLRESNLALVLQTVLAAPSGISRAGVAAATALTRSTVSRLADELVEAGVLAEDQPVVASGRGRPGTPLRAGERPVALGLQVNAGYLAARLVSLRGQVLAERVETGDFVGSDPAATLHRLGRLAARVRSDAGGRHTLVGAGIALPGLVSAGSNILLRAPNLGWSDVELGPLAGALGVADADLLVGNEADLAARSVATPAPGRPGPIPDFIYLSGEIGIGGAAVLDGRLLTGRHGWAGEIGHVCVDPEGPPCRCGSTGCLEQYAGRRVLLAAAGLPADATPAQLAEAVRAGDADARRAVDRAASALGVALASVVNVLDIPVIVLGGHLGVIADMLRPRLDAQLQDRVLSARWVPPTVEVPSGDLAPGATGAAFHVLERVLDDPAQWLGRES
jgi:predicted NBD/HSP70 family sugar kinase